MYTCLVAAAYIGFMFFVVKPVLRRLHNKFNTGHEGLNRTFVMGILIMLVCSAMAAESP